MTRTATGLQDNALPSFSSSASPLSWPCEKRRLSLLRNLGVSSNRNFDTEPLVSGVLLMSAVRRVEGVRKEVRYVRFDALEGDLLRRLTEPTDSACWWSSSSPLALEGVPTMLVGSGARDCLFDGVRKDDEGVRRSKRPSTRPFFWGVGPMDFRCATEVT